MSPPGEIRLGNPFSAYISRSLVCRGSYGLLGRSERYLRHGTLRPVAAIKTPVERPNPKVLSSNPVDGRNIARGYIRRRLRHECEFATHAPVSAAE